MLKQRQPRSRGNRDPVVAQTTNMADDRDDKYGVDDLTDMLDGDLQYDQMEFLTRLNPQSLVNVDKKSKKNKAKETKLSAGGDEFTGASQQRRKRRRGSDQSETELEFETHPRPSDWTENESEMHYFLPLKSNHGRLIHQEPVAMETTSSVVEEISNKDDPVPAPVTECPGDEVESTGASPPRVFTTVELFVQRQEKLEERKQTIADLSSHLVEDPEENISYLKRLRDLCMERDPDVAISVRKFAILSLMTVFKDITPSYHIRELTATEKAVKVKKEVRKLRNFEEGILHNYQSFLTLLEDTVNAVLNLRDKAETPKKKRKERKKPLDELNGGLVLSQEGLESLGQVALQCLCQLAVSLAHFNFRNNLLAVIIPRMNSKHWQGKVSQMCCETVERLFKNDSVGDVSLEAVQLICKMVKAKSYKTKPAVLDTFLHLQLSQVDEPLGVDASNRAKTKERRKAMKKDVTKLSKKQRKHLKEEKKLDRDLQEASAIESREKKSKLQTDILRAVFVTYFRILKNSRHSPLLPSVLRGLAKFAHMISVDFFSDLMSVLHSLAETGGLSNKECMQSVLTAFEILSGQGASLNIDPRQFYVQLYGALLPLDARSSDEDIQLAVECLDRLLRKRRQISLQRVLAFVKRLSTISLQLLPGTCLAVMATIRTFMQSYQHCERLLDTESVAGGGVFRPDVPDPEMCHASSTLLWELTVFRHHYAEEVGSYSSHLLSGAPSQGRGALSGNNARKTSQELIKEHSMGSTQGPVMGGVTPPPPHPWDRPTPKNAKRGTSDHYYPDRGLSLAYLKECELETLLTTEHLFH